MAKRIGKRTVRLEQKIGVIGYGAVVGKKEHEGPLGQEFDAFSDDNRFGEVSYEKAESRLQTLSVDTAVSKAGLEIGDIDCIFAGDLLNQCIGSTFGLRSTERPVVGLYGACSTMTLSLCMAATMLESGAAKTAVAVTSSHFCSAERQYRFPLEYGNQRTPTAQWTTTASGALVLTQGVGSVYIDEYCIGQIVDLGVTDQNNMGAAMAPSAADTLCHYFEDTGTTPEDFDLVFTGDLGQVGTDLLYDLVAEQGYALRCRHSDCGLLMFDREKQDVHAGGSGCGCSAAVLASYVMHRFEDGTFHDVLFCSTGALLSPTSVMQGESIPGVTHLVHLKGKK
ncbi:MAG: stage V sporulation protein AD [Clostridia bacterium]|nr:stage V sporulation protein AD [Clostridia bacterium]